MERSELNSVFYVAVSLRDTEILGHGVTEPLLNLEVLNLHYSAK